MAVEYGVEWESKALKELRKLDGAIRRQFLRKLQEETGDRKLGRPQFDFNL